MLWHGAAILRRPWAGLWEALPKASMSGWGFELTTMGIRVKHSTTAPPTPLSQVNLFELGPTYIECWNGAVEMQISQVNLFVLPQHSSHIQCQLVELFWVYNVVLGVCFVLCFTLAVMLNMTFREIVKFYIVCL